MRIIYVLLPCLLVACSATTHSVPNTARSLVVDSFLEHSISVRSAEEDPWHGEPLTVYASLVKEVLLRDSEHDPYVRMICRPSFEREWVVTIEEPKGRSATVQYVIVKRPIWLDPKPREIETTITVAQISKATARKFKQAWVAMLSNRSYMEPLQMGADGVIYHFATFIPEHDVLTREAWSPGSGAPSRRLVELGEMLRDITRMEAKDRAEFETSLNHKVDALLRQFPPYGLASQID